MGGKKGGKKRGNNGRKKNTHKETTPLVWTTSVPNDVPVSVAEIKQKFDALFANLPVHEVHTTNNKDRRELLRGTNIVLTPDKGNILFKHYIGTFDPLAQAKEMREVANQEDGRQRALWASSRGIGGGKTRTLEEIRLAMWTLPNVMCLAITFNGSMEYYHSNEGELLDKGKKAFTLSVVLRLAVSLYNLKFKDISGETKPLQKKLCEIVNKHEAKDVLNGFLLHALGRVQAAVKSESEERWLVVVLVDEIMRVITAFGNSTVNVDIASELRQGVLDSQEDNGPAFSLMMSSLQPRPNWVTTSSRVVKAVQLCEELPSMDILVDWWFREALQAVDHQTRLRLVKMVAQTLQEDIPLLESELNEKFSDSSTEPADGMTDLESKLKSLVKFPSVVSQLPRGVEIVKQYLDKKANSEFNDTFSTGLWEHLLKEMGSRYASQNTGLDATHVYAAVFGHYVSPNDPVVGGLVERSVYVNSFAQLTEKFIPKSALAYLIATNNWKEVVQLTPLRDLAKNIMTSTNLEYGDALEQCSFEWLPIRLEVLVKVHHELERELPIARQRLDKLEDQKAPQDRIDRQSARVKHLESIDSNKPSRPLLNFIFGVAQGFRKVSMKLSSVEPRNADRLQSSRKDSNEIDPKFFDQLSEFDSHVAGGVVIVRRTAENDRFDLLVVFKDADDGKPRLLFLDCKAQTEDTQPKDTLLPNTKKLAPGALALESCKQKLGHVRQLQDAAKSNEDAQQSTVGQALAKGRFHFVGFTTHKQSEIRSQMVSPSDPNLVMIGRDEAKNFFGPMWPVFDAVHTDAATQKRSREGGPKAT